MRTGPDGPWVRRDMNTTLSLMKIPGSSLFLCVLAPALLAGPLQLERIAAEARWVMHADLDALVATSVGDTLAREALDPGFARAAAEAKERLGVDFDWRRVHSITMYGSRYTGPERLRGVMLIDTGLDVRGALEAALDRQAASGLSSTPRLQRFEDAPLPLYSIREELYIAVPDGAPVVIGKDRQNVMRATEVLAGTAASLASNPESGTFAAPRSSFLFLAARGFSDTAAIPPKARLLRMADALEFTAGELAGRVDARLSMTARTEDAAGQMRQVVQGLTALGALSQPDNPDLQALLAGLRVEQSGATVTLQLSLPAADISRKVVERHSHRRNVQ